MQKQLISLNNNRIEQEVSGKKCVYCVIVCFKTFFSLQRNKTQKMNVNLNENLVSVVGSALRPIYVYSFGNVFETSVYVCVPLQPQKQTIYTSAPDERDDSVSTTTATVVVVVPVHSLHNIPW